MRKFKFSKLVRDEIVKQILDAGNVPHWKELSDTEYLNELKKKIIEEAEEIPQASGDVLIKELADIQEIIESLLGALRVSKKDFIRIKKDKSNKDGSFKKKYYIEEVGVKEDSDWIQYYLKNPLKYPEVE